MKKLFHIIYPVFVFLLYCYAVFFVINVSYTFFEGMFLLCMYAIGVLVTLFFYPRIVKRKGKKDTWYNVGYITTVFLTGVLFYLIGFFGAFLALILYCQNFSCPLSF
jgi:Na+/melibiose symporter-like transporter